MSHLNNCNILSDVQFGFHCRCSVELQLLCTVNDFVLNLNNKKQTDNIIILLDLSKTFDKIAISSLFKTQARIRIMVSDIMDFFLPRPENTVYCM